MTIFIVADGSREQGLDNATPFWAHPANNTLYNYLQRKIHASTIHAHSSATSTGRARRMA